METTKKRVLLIGCGVAGPALAMFLQRVGFTPLVYEGHPEPDNETGFFLNLAPNGVAVLEELGLKDQVLAQGTPTKRTVFQNHRGKQLAENPETMILIKRGLLTKVLREAAIGRGIHVAFGKRLTDIEIAGSSPVRACFEDGTEAHSDVLIGCDGIHSRTRRAVLPHAPEPRYLGVIDSGGFTRNSSAPSSDGIMRMTFGKSGFFGYQKAPSGEVYWFENFAQETEPDRKQLAAIPDEAWRTRLLDLHRDDHASIAEIIRSTEEIGKWPNYEMPPLPTWHKGPVCLIGDAAHAMSPSAGQGAAMALEDAMVLAMCLRDVSDTRGAFEAFERLRRNRVEKIATDARRNSDQKGPTNALTRTIRDWVLPLFLRMGVKSAQQTYAYRINWNEKVTE